MISTAYVLVEPKTNRFLHRDYITGFNYLTYELNRAMFFELEISAMVFMERYPGWSFIVKPVTITLE